MKQLKTVALYDSLETMVVLPKSFYVHGVQHKSSGICVAAGGENGTIFFFFFMCMHILCINKIIEEFKKS